MDTPVEDFLAEMVPKPGRDGPLGGEGRLARLPHVPLTGRCHSDATADHRE